MTTDDTAINDKKHAGAESVGDKLRAKDIPYFL
jgi:hypothetical protein